MNYNRASDIDLLECCRRDDVKAYNELFDRYVGKLYRVGMRYLKDETLVEELAMDILLNLWDRRSEIKVERNLSSYLFGAMHHKAISQLRKQAPVMLDIQSLDDDHLVADFFADEQLILKDVEAHYEKLLSKLSPQRQTAFRLSREQGMSHADIATAMNLSPNTVKNHINAALGYLRNHYKRAAIATLIGFFSFLFH